MHGKSLRPIGSGALEASGRGRAVNAFAAGVITGAAFSLGAAAVGAAAIGALAIGRMVMGSGRIRRLHIDELTVGRLNGRDLAPSPAGEDGAQ